MSYNQYQNTNQFNYQNQQNAYQSGSDWELYQSHSDPFNYPPPQRKDLMNLQTIQPYETGFYNVKNNTLRDANLNISDIRGAQPKFKIQDLNKPDHHNIHDIEGSQPKPHIQFTQYKKVSNILNHDDIKGSHPNINKFYTKREPFNPLEPYYKLQEAQQIIVDPPKFLRDTLYIADIEGTKARKQILAYDKIYPEIDGSRPKKQFYPKDYIDSLNVRDINNKKQIELNRCVNPLNPTYKWQVEEDNTQSQSFGYVNGSNPRQLHKSMVKPFDKYSSTDIKGTNAGSLVKKYNMNHRYAYSNTDIEGSQANSRKVGIQTKRCLNPLRPDYQLLGNSESDNAYGGHIYKNNEQKQNHPRSQLAASASQNLISTKQPPQSVQPQHLSQSQSVTHLPPRVVGDYNQGQQQNTQHYLQPGYQHQQNNNRNEMYQSDVYGDSQVNEQQYYDQNVMPQSIDQQFQNNKIPQMFYQGANQPQRNNIPQDYQNQYQKSQQQIGNNHQQQSIPNNQQFSNQRYNS